MPKYGKTNYIIIILSSQAYLYKSFGTQNHKKTKDFGHKTKNGKTIQVTIFVCMTKSIRITE